MLFQNARIENASELADFHVKNGLIAEIGAQIAPLVGEQFIDLKGKRRGVTRVKELLETGINVFFGQDDIFDPWYPLGCGSLRDVVFLGLHVCQMMGYEDIL